MGHEFDFNADEIMEDLLAHELVDFVQDKRKMEIVDVEELAEGLKKHEVTWNASTIHVYDSFTTRAVVPVCGRTDLQHHSLSLSTLS